MTTDHNINVNITDIDALIADNIAQAEEIARLEDLQDEVEELREEIDIAYTKGYGAGHNDGYAEGYSEGFRDGDVQ
jgi:flagellar biosynthesis/type III secretory pathway protein FliH